MFSNKPVLFSWVFAILMVFVMVGVGLALETPVGSIGGKIAVQQPGFNLATYDIRKHKVYAMAVGPRSNSRMIERGVWVKNDGTFRIDHLPKGEYSLVVKAQGFETYNRSGIFVDEGQVSEPEKSITLHILEPSVNVAASTRVFTTKETPAFWLNATGADKTTVKLYRYEMKKIIMPGMQVGGQPMDISSALSIYKPSEAQKKAMLAGLKPIETFKRTLKMDQEDWAREQFKLSNPLPKGDYLAIAEVSNFQNHKDWNLLWFSVSDMGIIVKYSPDKAMVRAIDLNTLKPRTGVKVSLFSRVKGAASLGDMVTGADGMASVPIHDKANSMSLMAYGEQGEDHAYGGMEFWRGESDLYDTYFYTERPVYRLGQSVYFKGITRLLESNGFRNPQSSLALKVKVMDPDNEIVWEKSLKTNTHGTFNGVYDVPVEGKTGAYQVSIEYPDGAFSYGSFEVAQYRKPEYSVEVTPIEKRVTAGAKFKARIRAQYYFGAPVTNARVKYTVYAATDWETRYKLMPRPEYYGFYDDWAGSEGYDDAGYAGDYITEGFAQTDENGEAVVEIQTQAMKPSGEGPLGADMYDKRYKVEAEVTDLSRMSVIGSGYETVTAGDFALFVQPDSYIYKVNEPMDATVTAVDYDGKPVSGRTLQVKLMRWHWRDDGDSYLTETIEAPQEIVTNAEGKARVRFQLKDSLPSDTYYIAVEAKDAGNHTVTGEGSVWIASKNYPYSVSDKAAQQEPFSVKLDKPVYQPGDTARVLISAPVTGAEGSEALVSIEGTKIHEVRLVPMDATAKLVEIPLKDAYAPNVYVTVTFVGKKHQFYNQSEVIRVSPESHFLRLAVTTDKEKYKPGEDVNYTIQATYPDGSPAADTEVSLGVVDESIYAIRPEAAGDIRKFFYHQFENWVVTACSFPEEYSGGPDKIEPRVRKDFRDMAAWQPDLVTDENGIARTKVHLPDNLTTWRATVRAVSMATDVGSGIQKIIATQDLIVRLAMPRFYTEGDEGVLTAVVHNYTDKAQDVQLTMSVTPEFQMSLPAIQMLKVDPDKAGRFSWPVKVVQPGMSLVGIKAVGQTEGDAMELQRPVLPLGVQIFDSQNGIMTGDGSQIQEFPVKLPSGVNPKTAGMTLSLAASSIGPVLGNLATLIDYPYGCVEQTMSRLMPSVIAYRVHKALNVSLDAVSVKRFDKVYREALKKLYADQHGDGGWGWWANDSSNAYLTAYVMEGFNQLRQAGQFEIAKEATDRGKNWLKESRIAVVKQLTDPKLVASPYQQAEAWTDLAYMSYVLEFYGEKIPASAKKAFLSKAENLPAQGLAYMTLALREEGDTAGARTVYDLLLKQANRSGNSAAATAMDWSPTPAKSRRLLGGGYDYRFTDVETTALALRAVLAMEPENSDRLEAIKGWLLAQRDQSGWQNTKTTATVLRALLDEELNSRKSGTTDMMVLISTASRQLGSFDFNPRTMYEAQKLITVPIEVFNIKKDGPGRLYYQSLLSYWLPLQPGSTVPQKPLPDGLKIQRAFFRLHPTAMSSTGTIRFKSVPLEGNRVQAGETILMKVSVESPLALPYVLLTVPLPSGGEVVAGDAKENLLEDTEGNDTDSPFQGDWGRVWWSHQEVLDDRVVFFSTNLPSGKRMDFYTMVRMEMPGKFVMNPARLEGMYTNRVRAISTVDGIRVLE